MATSVIVGQAVAHPSIVAATLAAGGTAASAPKTGTVLSINLTVAQATATGKGGETFGTTTNGAAVQWVGQQQVTLHPVADLT